HLAGQSTRDCLRFIAHRGRDLGLLVVAARRREERFALPAAITVPLGPLDLAAVEAVVGAERASALFARSGGHPLFLAELAAAVSASRRALVHREAAHALAARSRADPLDVAYHARLGGEGELAAGALVEAARAAGDRFDPEEAERLLDQAVHLQDTPEARLQ